VIFYKYKNEYIPVTNQYPYFRVLERYQFKAVLCNNGRYLIKSTNEEVMLLKRFFDGSKTIYAALLTLVRE
jgi:hypothetical protein